MNATIRMNQYRNYICFEKRERRCTECKKIKPFGKFSECKPGVARSQCKKCRAKTNTIRHQEKKLEAFPNLYTQCDNDDCCYIVKISLIKNNKCPKCGSELAEIK